MNLQRFESLERGMSYEEACSILGQSGILISSETACIEPGLQVMSLVTEIFEWPNDDGSVIRLMFKNGALNDSVQEGLD